MKRLLIKSDYVAVQPLQEEKKMGSILLPEGEERFALGLVISGGERYHNDSVVMYQKSVGRQTLLLGEDIVILKYEDVIGEVIEV